LTEAIGNQVTYEEIDDDHVFAWFKVVHLGWSANLALRPFREIRSPGLFISFFCYTSRIKIGPTTGFSSISTQRANFFRWNHELQAHTYMKNAEKRSTVAHCSSSSHKNAVEDTGSVHPHSYAG